MKEICIEHYYTDEEICRKDSNQQRIFLSTEFKLRSGRHQSLPLVTNPNKIKANQLKIIDDSVFDENDQNVALSKNAFADYIYNEEQNFNNFDFRSFNEIFEIIDKILKYHSEKKRSQ